MVNNKINSIIVLCCCVLVTANANSWDKFITIKPTNNKAIESSRRIQPSSVQSNSSYNNNYKTNRKIENTVQQPTQQVQKTPYNTHTANVQPAQQKPVVTNPTYQPEIIAPYEMDRPAYSHVQEQTQQQAQQQLLQQRAQYQQQDQWEKDAQQYYPVEADGFNKTYSQWFDNDVRPVFYLRGGYIEETQFGEFGATEIATADLRARLFKITDFLPGASLDAWLFADGMYFIDNPNMTALPDGLIAAGLDVGLWWRFTNGFSWELRGAPGIYSDPSAPVFSGTGTLNMHYTLSESFCFILGATYRPEWDMEIFPNIGFIWQPSDQIRLHVALPESRIDLFPRHIINVFATLTWDNTTYWLDNEEPLPDVVTFDALRASVGATLTLFDDLELTAEVGTHLQHELTAEVKDADTIELDETTFIRASIGNRF